MNVLLLISNKINMSILELNIIKSTKFIHDFHMVIKWQGTEIKFIMLLERCYNKEQIEIINDFIFELSNNKRCRYEEHRVTASNGGLSFEIDVDEKVINISTIQCSMILPVESKKQLVSAMKKIC